ncbi:MAG: hypothetical protein FJ263_00630 [Planctomycetes bacterium]|nr:hypothetical protein [Planctomycetota bacterium]
MENKPQTNSPGELKALADFLAILDELGIVYALGGSMACSVYGKVRFTEDADVTVEPFSSVADALVKKLSSNFYVSPQAVRQALIQRGSFNVIHIAAAFKIDAFIRNETPFQKQLLQRRRQVVIPALPDAKVWAVSPEDILLLKLDWYKQGGCTSEKQWNDILGLIGIQRNLLDQKKLLCWADELGVRELLEQALRKDAELNK